LKVTFAFIRNFVVDFLSTKIKFYSRTLFFTQCGFSSEPLQINFILIFRKLFIIAEVNGEEKITNEIKRTIIERL